MSFTTSFEKEIKDLEDLFKERWDTILPIVEDNETALTILKDLKFKIELECGMATKFLKAMDYKNALVNFGLAERNYGVFFHIAQQLWQEHKKGCDLALKRVINDE
jgi:hypothetical protein